MVVGTVRRRKRTVPRISPTFPFALLRVGQTGAHPGQLDLQPCRVQRRKKEERKNKECMHAVNEEKAVLQKAVTRLGIDLQ